MTTQNEIREWLKRGKKNSATHMIVVCDTFDYEDYPVYVYEGDDVNKVLDEYKRAEMSKIMEVYSYSIDLETQINESRAYNL